MWVVTVETLKFWKPWLRASESIGYTQQEINCSFTVILYFHKPRSKGFFNISKLKWSTWAGVGTYSEKSVNKQFAIHVKAAVSTYIRDVYYLIVLAQQIYWKHIQTLWSIQGTDFYKNANELTFPYLTSSVLLLIYNASRSSLQVRG